MTETTDAVVHLLNDVVAAKLPMPVSEYRFHPVRRWRFDLAWPNLRIAVEIEGGSYVGGRHSCGPGFWRDCEKYNEAALDGWIVIRVIPRMVRDGRAIEWLIRAVRSKITLDNLRPRC